MQFPQLRSFGLSIDHWSLIVTRQGTPDLSVIVQIILAIYSDPGSLYAWFRHIAVKCVFMHSIKNSKTRIYRQNTVFEFSRLNFLRP